MRSSNAYSLARGAVREQGRSKTGMASLPHVKMAPKMLSSPLLARDRRRLFRLLDILTEKWATWDLPGECRFLLNTQQTFFKKEKDPAQEITADIPEERDAFDQEGADPKKVRLIQMGYFFRKCVSRRLQALSENEIAALTTPMRQLGMVLKAALKLSPSSTSSSTMNGRQDPLSRRCPES